MSQLRAYQVGAIADSRAVLRSGKKRIALYSPTGSGKTVMAEAFIQNAISKVKSDGTKLRVAFVVNRIGLVKQTSKRFFKAGIRHGIIQSGNTCNQDAQVLICSIQTVAKRGLPPVDLIIIDEAHGVPGSKDYRQMIFAYNNVPVIGLTATPFSKGMGARHKELGDEPLFQELVVATTIRELIEMGFLVDCEIYAPSEPDLSGLKLQRNSFGEMDYAEKDLAEKVDTPSLIGDIVRHWRKMANNKPTVCFATNIAHSQHICDQFNLSGIPAEHIDSYMKDDERDAIMKRVESGETLVICNVGILTEGWDFPACEVMILARPTKSLIRWVQMVGRILRPFLGKVRGIVLDHSGSTHELGYPTEDLPLELDDGTSKASKKQPNKDGDNPEPKATKCFECHYMKPAGIHVCPKCGAKPQRKSEVVTKDGELKLVDRTKKGMLAQHEKQDIYSQLLTMQAESVAKKKGADGLGYSDGWVANKFESIFGVRPKGMERTIMPVNDDLRKFIQHQNIRYARGKSKGEQHAAH